MPANQQAITHTEVDPIHSNFIHNINEKGIRFYLGLDDGQLWSYHDPRTWGTITLVEGEKPRDDAQIAAFGPDWMNETSAAIAAIVNTRTKTTAKEVLTNQRISCGIGNYIACEALFIAGIHPRDSWSLLSEADRVRTACAVRQFLQRSLLENDHSHWQVFQKLGSECPVCKSSDIQYIKDGTHASAKRGSYFCPSCQQRRGSSTG
jgi:formamidopyrimidine-DNA glycosylase